MYINGYRFVECYIFFFGGGGGGKLGMFVGKLNLICKWNLFGCGLNFIWFIIDIILNEV